MQAFKGDTPHDMREVWLTLKIASDQFNGSKVTSLCWGGRHLDKQTHILNPLAPTRNFFTRGWDRKLQTPHNFYNFPSWRIGRVIEANKINPIVFPVLITAIGNNLIWSFRIRDSSGARNNFQCRQKSRFGSSEFDFERKEKNNARSCLRSIPTTPFRSFNLTYLCCQRATTTT